METKMTVSDELLVAYLQGQTTEKQSIAVEEWYGASSENRKALEQLYYVMFVADRLAAMQKVDVEKSLAQLKRRAYMRKYMPSRVARRVIRYAAAVAVLILLSFGAGRVMERASHPFVVETSVGERVSVTLPDGSSAEVNSCSRLEYTSNIFSGGRNVDMSGEIYFEVRKHGRAPFTVNSLGLGTEVLGTKFNIRANENERLVTASLLEGSIALSAANMNGVVKVSPGQYFVYDPATGKGTLHERRNPESCILWTSGCIRFDHTSLGDIALELERHFNVNIEFADDNLRKERFSGDFETTDNIHYILSALGMTEKFSYKTEGNNITITN